jgi:hypothetical protein
MARSISAIERSRPGASAAIDASTAARLRSTSPISQSAGEGHAARCAQDLRSDRCQPLRVLEQRRGHVGRSPAVRDMGRPLDG